MGPRVWQITVDSSAFLDLPEAWQQAMISKGFTQFPQHTFKEAEVPIQIVSTPIASGWLSVSTGGGVRVLATGHSAYGIAPTAASQRLFCTPGSLKGVRRFICFWNFGHQGRQLGLPRRLRYHDWQEDD